MLSVIVRNGALGRCAYCHAAVARQDRAACATCLAVHHAECWTADDRCAACGGDAVLVASENREAFRELRGAEAREQPRGCAYCGEPVESFERLVCPCLSVHHPGCWSGSCSSCGGVRALRAASVVTVRPVAPSPEMLVAKIVFIGLAFGSLLFCHGGPRLAVAFVFGFVLALGVGAVRRAVPVARRVSFV